MPPSKPDESDGQTVSTRGLYWSCVLLGCSLLAPWSSLLSAIDYFEDIYPDYDVMRWISLTYMPVTLGSIIVNTFIPVKDKGHGRVTAGYVLFVLTLIFMPLMDWTMIRNDKGTNTTFGFLIVTVFLSAVADGIAQPTLAGISLYLPSGFYQGFLMGMGVSAVVMSSLRALTKAAFTESTNGLRTSACIFLLTAAVLCIASLLAHRYIVVPHPLLSEDPIDEEGIPLSAPEDSTSVRPKKSQPQPVLYGDIFKKLRLESFILILVCSVTLTIYPGVASDVESDSLGSWYGVMLVFIYSVGDLAGRSFPSHWYFGNSKIVLLAGCLRLLFIPITFLASLHNAHPFLMSLLLVMLGISQGYMNVCVYGLGQKKLNGVEATFVGGNILVFVVLFGLSLGSLGSIAWSHIM